jgi:nicotinate-nucleotide pyrophosphorylase (carboxylating)
MEMNERIPPSSHTPERRRAPRTVTPLQTPSVDTGGVLRFPLQQGELTAHVRAALDEDGAFNDLTTIATVVSERRARATLVAKGHGVVCGIPLALEAFRLLDPKVAIRVDVEDGQRVTPGTPVLFLSGHARGLLSAERVALNYLQRLSGVASLTAQFVDAVKGTKAKILDTRKTTPGWRTLDKYAVRAGGGMNHRMDLSTGVLIKDNHLSAVENDIRAAVSRARAIAPKDVRVEVECENLGMVAQALAAGADIIMLDNMPPDTMREAVAITAGRAKLEASGGVTLDTIRAIAETGVDFISIGALTHSARSLDVSLEVL